MQMHHITVCDGEKVYLIFNKKDYSLEQASKDAKEKFGADIDISYADAMNYGQFSLCKHAGEYYCISKKEKEQIKDVL